MAKKFPLQTDFPEPIRSWGCYYMALYRIAAELEPEISTTNTSILSGFYGLVNAGKIKNNGIPIGHNGWYRCYIMDAGYIISALAGSAAKVIKKTEQPKNDYYIACCKTRWGGTHFYVPEQGNIRGGYNPDPTLPVVKILSYREVQRVG